MLFDKYMKMLFCTLYVRLYMTNRWYLHFYPLTRRHTLCKSKSKTCVCMYKLCFKPILDDSSYMRLTPRDSRTRIFYPMCMLFCPLAG